MGFAEGAVSGPSAHSSGRAEVVPAAAAVFAVAGALVSDGDLQPTSATSARTADEDDEFTLARSPARSRSVNGRERGRERKWNADGTRTLAHADAVAHAHTNLPKTSTRELAWAILERRAKVAATHRAAHPLDMTMRRIALWFCATALLAGTAHAQGTVDDATRSSARQLGEEAGALFTAGDFAGALDRYDRADALVHVPTLGVRAARCLVKLGRLVEAAERYLTVTRTELPAGAPAVHRDAVREAEEERGALLTRIPAVVIAPSGPVAAGTTVTLDGAVVPPALFGVKRHVNPGAHTVAATRDGRSLSFPFTAREGQVVPLALDLGALEVGPAVPGSPPQTADRPAPTSSTQRTLGFVGLGLGGAGLAIGGIVGAVVGIKKADLVNSGNCTADLQCAGKPGSSAWSQAEAYNRLRAASTAGLVAGGVLAATGLVLVLTAPKGQPAARDRAVALGLGPAGAELRGRF